MQRFMTWCIVLATTAALLTSPLYAAPEPIGPVSLRAYGKLSGSFEPATAAAGYSLLRLECESADKAMLLQAKYLSDAQGLPGVTTLKLSFPGGPEATGLQVKDQGCLLAARRGPSVVIVAGISPQAASAGAAVALTGAGWQFGAPASALPRYLGKWDQFGWNFYNYAWFKPDKTNAPHLVDYDYTQPYNYDSEYQWAKQTNTGMVFWDTQFSQDRAGGMNDLPLMSWAAQACDKYGLNFQIQPTLGDNLPWWSNRYRDETMGKMPGYVGSFHAVNNSYFGGPGAVSWCSQKGKDELLALSQQWVQRYVDDPNLTTIMEPHCEVAHGDYDILLEYGPLADQSYRTWLQNVRKYDLPGLAQRWGQKLARWEDVKVPEVASFLGWGPDAVDLTGVWKVKYATQEEGQQQNLFDPSLDTSGWGEMVAPGNDREMFISLNPAWWRRGFSVPGPWLQANAGKPIYLYLWDLNRRRDKAPVIVYLNGQLVATDDRATGLGFFIADVSKAVQSGGNLLTVYLPDGFLGYRVYLAATAPTQYPYLGKAMNARWVDFREWQTWTRADAIRRGMEAIRGADPNRPISLAAPDSVVDYAKQLAVKYGGFFHNTGYMSGFYAPYFARMMRSVNLPSSAEPGGPASTLPELKAFWWRVTMTGLESYNYFIHIGNVLWDPEMRTWFEQQQPMIHLLGKYHMPDTRVASLTGVRCERLFGWPWVQADATRPAGGAWNQEAVGHLAVPSDLLTEMDVESGMLNQYDLVYDEQTTVMSPALVAKIADWVKAGGTFVTLANTGRHTETEPNTWPISALTNCDVLWTSPVKQTGEYEWQPLAVEPGQTMLDTAYWGQPNRQANGLGLKPRGDDVQVLLRWKNDNSMAVGVRPLGKGRVFIVGTHFTNDRFWWGDPQSRDRLNNEILAACGVKNQDDAQVNDQLISGNTGIHDAPAGRHFLSNNGLYDVYLICNQTKEVKDFVLSLPQGAAGRTWAYDVLPGQSLPGAAAAGRVSFPALKLEPADMRALLVPRGQITQAPRDWLQLQEGWWQGTAPGQVLTPDKFDWVSDLTKGWTLAAAEGVDPAAASQPGVKLAGTPNLELGIWTYAVPNPPQNGVFRREFTVPAAWKDGKVWLHWQSWTNGAFMQKGRIWLDGVAMTGWVEGAQEMYLEGIPAGTTHALLAEIQGTPYIAGSPGDAWLEYEPKPAEEIVLQGQWQPSPDGLTRTAPVTLPGEFTGRMARGMFVAPRGWKGQTVMLHAVTDPKAEPLLAVLVNGKMIRRHHHINGTRMDINITPLLKYGEANEIEIVAPYAGRKIVTELSLRAYAPNGMYP
ncbi:MAG TPA: hypothetical protein VGM19_14230 [Armatimonadota bacterium]|jgi:hypothetical protein